MHYLVGLFEPYGVNLPKSHKLGQCSPNRFNGRLSLAFHLPAKPAPQPRSLFPLVLIYPDRDPDALFVALAQALCPDRAVFTVASFGQVMVLQRVFFRFAPAECSLLTFRTEPVIFVFNKRKAFGAALVSAMRRNVAYQPVPFQEIVVFATAVAGIGQYIAP